MKVGVALFGLGRAGLFHLPNLVANPDVSVRWLVDIASIEEKVRQICDKYSLQEAQFADKDDCQKVLDDPSTLAVVITTPTRYHEDIIKRALAAGKHVFCEKPISFTADVVRSCYQEAERCGRVLFCGFNRRFEEEHARLKEVVHSGKLGAPRIVHYNWRDPSTSAETIASYITPSGGIFCDSAIHQLDYIPWMLGQKPSSVIAVGGRTSQFADVYKNCGDVDSTMIILQFPSGVHAVIENIRELHIDDFYFRLEVVGTKDTYMSYKIDRETKCIMRMNGQQSDVKELFAFWPCYKLEMDCFIRVVQGKEDCPVLPAEVIQASHLADLCLVSLREGRVVSCQE